MRKAGTLMSITLHTAIDPATLPEQTEKVQGHFRDEFQLGIDKDVAGLKINTAKAGWPEHDPTKLFHRYVVDKGDSPAMKEIIRRAANLHKVVPVFYKDVPTEAGHAVVKFHVARKTDKDGKFVKDDTLNPDGSLVAKPETPKPVPVK
jgi:hypothetical protein